MFVTDCRSGVKDSNNLVYGRTLPGFLSASWGSRSKNTNRCDWALRRRRGYVRVEIEHIPRQTFHRDPIRRLDPSAAGDTPAETIAHYEEPHLSSFAAVTRHRFGEGYGWYLGTIVAEEEFYDGIVGRILADAGIEPIVSPPPGVEAVLRSNDNRDLLFLINHTDEAKTVEVPKGKQELLTATQTPATLELKAFGVAVIEM